MIFSTNPHNIIHLTLGILLHYLGILKIHIFCKYSADMENANKMRFQCNDFNSSTCVTVYAECVYVFLIKIGSSSMNAMLIVDKHCSDVCCDEFPMGQTDRKNKQGKEHSDTEKFTCNRYGKNTCYLRDLKYQNLWMNNKV